MGRSEAIRNPWCAVALVLALSLLACAGSRSPGGVVGADGGSEWTNTELGEAFLACVAGEVPGETCCQWDGDAWTLSQGACPDRGCGCEVGFVARVLDTDPCVTHNDCVAAHAGTCQPTAILPGGECPPEAPFECRHADDSPTGPFCTDCPCPMLDTSTTGCSDEILSCECGYEPDCCDNPVDTQFTSLCLDGEDCYSGFCVYDEVGPLCTKLCDGECPCGWRCEGINIGPDPLSVCVPPFVGRCRPCVTDDECRQWGDSAARCIADGDEGRFCAPSCDGDFQGCPEDYYCSDVFVEPLSEGITEHLCKPGSAGGCGCSPLSIDQGASTVCAVTNEYGRCEGTRFCTYDGLSECDAATPAADDTCNGLDDDCDGATDEEVPDLDGDGLPDC